MWERLGLPRDPREWEPGDSEYVTSLFADPDKTRLTKALGLVNAKCPTREEVEKAAKELSEKVFQHWNALKNILDRYEAVIRKRWIKKSQEQRKIILLEAWPDMSAKHRPEFHALRRETDDQRKAGTRFREAYLWPSINLEDLCRGKTLLQFLNTRGRYLPATFVSADLESLHVGLFSGAIGGTYMVNCEMALQGDTPATYGKVTLSDYLSQMAGKGQTAGEGLDILEVQERVLRFLLDISRIILKDKNGSLADIPRSPLPEPPPLNAGSTEWRSAAVLAAEAPYTVPHRVDLASLKALASARLADAEDHFWALREDPGYFTDFIGDWSEHSSEAILVYGKKRHPDLTNPITKQKFWDRTLGSVVHFAYENIFSWRTMQQQLNQLIELEQSIGSFQFQREEEHPEYLLVLRRIKYFLEHRLIPEAVMRLMVHFPASPSMRNLFQLLPDHNGYGGFSVYPRTDEGIIESKDYMIWLYAQMIDDTRFQVCGFANLATEFDRLTQSNAKQKARVTPFLYHVFEGLGLVSELQNQLSIYRPRIFLQRGNKILASREEKDLGDWASKLVEPMFNVTKYLSKELSGETCIHLGAEGDPTTGRFYYPVSKRRTKETNDAMQRAEQNLDSLWAKFDEQLRSKVGPDTYMVIQGMIPSQRQLQRTPDWVEPLQSKEVKAVQSDDLQLVEDVARINLELEERSNRTVARDLPTVARTKPKTRGVTQTAIDTAPLPEELPPGTLSDKQPTFILKRRAFKVFSTIFHNPLSQDQPGEIPWVDFLYAMVSTGFVPEKLYGSVWQFNPTNLDVERSIHFHEPHPHSKIPFRVARRIGRRLNRAYGWTGARFALE
ncbi:hypothetical protein K432DRAFT_308042 [Lepidopterella palustris CBS 459.81]|uniref:Uncharacterized protein n=1 Tax=Lepidopterella palustris CBS 459.81 TaxID=1314670 RepID=A0A8E2E1M9_9PEZI|nr:hypothetical protein K432DRAFT_308042 [Lepidopterella palustris CBS 459.81]